MNSKFTLGPWIFFPVNQCVLYCIWYTVKEIHRYSEEVSAQVGKAVTLWTVTSLDYQVCLGSVVLTQGLSFAHIPSWNTAAWDTYYIVCKPFPEMKKIQKYKMGDPWAVVDSTKWALECCPFLLPKITSDTVIGRWWRSFNPPCVWDLYLEACQKQSKTERLSPFISPANAGLKQNREVLFVDPPSSCLPFISSHWRTTFVRILCHHIFSTIFVVQLSPGLNQAVKTIDPCCVLGKGQRLELYQLPWSAWLPALWFLSWHLEKAANCQN